MAAEEIRKGPWTEQEDVQLVFYVNLFGDRQWDFIAKVSGLRRTGKSCRLRWVNYLHPGLKHGKMTPNEERLVLELHSKWGNRWSKIARKLPGRTDNEIKNYWRALMRKKAQEKKKAILSSSLSSSSPSSSSSNTSSTISSKGNSPTVESVLIADKKDRNFYDISGMVPLTTREKKTDEEKKDWANQVYYMDELWKDFELCNVNSFYNEYNGDGGWDVPLWGTVEEESNMFLPIVK